MRRECGADVPEVAKEACHRVAFLRCRTVVCGNVEGRAGSGCVSCGVGLCVVRFKKSRDGVGPLWFVGGGVCSVLHAGSDADIFKSMTQTFLSQALAFAPPPAMVADPHSSLFSLLHFAGPPCLLGSFDAGGRCNHLKHPLFSTFLPCKRSTAFVRFARVC